MLPPQRRPRRRGTTPVNVDRSPFDRARSLAGGLVSTARLSSALVAAHRQVDLAGLDAAIGLLCAKALDLEPEQGRLLLPELNAVLDELALLSGALTEHSPPG
jgi:hypothetical protein